MTRGETGTGQRRSWRDPGLPGVLALSGVAVLIHIIPLLLPRNMPEQELAIARATPDPAHRVRFLLPLKNNEKSTPANLREAAELLLSGAPAEAHELVEEADRRHPGDLETLLLMARVCDVERMERCVNQSLERAEKAAPTDPRPLLLRADLREQNGDVQGAVEALQRAHDQAPTDTFLALRYGRLLSRTGKPEEAMAVFRALDGKLTHARLLVEQGMVRAKEGRDRDAVKLLQEAVQSDPRLAEGHFELGLAWFRLGNEIAAEDALRQADRLDISNQEPLATLCAIQLKTGQIEAARTSRMDLERRFPQRMDTIRASCTLP
ncbi:tetratricopeptide repeat protein [Myxococcaceae bacterium JPH2]|nr:tetratricopeptide repeat protein [Myxococcaceae bacterium JPH2]